MALDSIRSSTITAIILSVVLAVAPAVAVGPPATAAGGQIEEGTAAGASGNATARSPSVPDSAPRDPETDVLGWERGVWYNETIDVDQSDGLDDAELDRLVGRTMARVERLRGLEFTDDVNVRFLARSTYRETVVPNTTFGAATGEQLWEATFVWGEHTDAGAQIRTYLGDAVLGYAPEEGVEGVTIVTRDGTRVVSERVLAHELVHVLQDQHYDFSNPRYRRHTWDGELAKDGVVEGEAAYLDYQYGSRCGEAWDCTAAPADWSGASVPDVGVYPLLSQQPYRDGAAYVGRLVERGGWDAVAAAHRDLPASSEQVVHATDDAPRRPSVADRSADEWTRRDVEVVGEVGLFGMFLQQSRRYPDNATVRSSDRYESAASYDTFNYSAPPSDGWGGDALVAYGNGTHRGYVWQLTWDSTADARQFVAAYETLLRSYGARNVDDGVWRIPEDQNEFSDAFHVARDGSSVTVVNAPSVRALGDVRTPLRETVSGAGTTRKRSTPSARSTSVSEETDGGAAPTTGTEVPGFGVLDWLLALAGAVAVSTYRR